MFSIDKLKRMRFMLWVIVAVIVLCLGIPLNMVNAQSNKSINKGFNANEIITEDFTDVKPDDWFYEDIQKAKESGYISGYPDGTFKPNNPMTRAEFVTLTNKVFDFEGITNTEFTDVNVDDWFYVEIQKAVNAEYISGYPDETFRPNNPISRQEVAVIIGKIKKLELDEEFADDYTDAATIPQWSKAYIGAVGRVGYMNGYPDGTFKPNNPITRAEAVTTVISKLSYSQYAYVTNAKDDTVSVIRISDNTVIDTIKVGDYPAEVEIAPNGYLAYVVNQEGGSVSVIRILDNKVIDTIPVGHGPNGIEIMQNGQFVYVTNVVQSTVSVIQTSDNTVVHTIEVGNNPMEIGITPNGQFAYVTNFNDSTVSVIRISDNTVIDTIFVGNKPFGIEITPNGQFAYVTNYGDDSVSVIKVLDNKVIDTIPVGGGPVGVGITPDGQFVYITNQKDYNVSVIKTSDNTVVDNITMEYYIHGIGITPNGQLAYIANPGDKIVSVIRISDNAVVETIPVGNYPIHVGITPIIVSH